MGDACHVVCVNCGWSFLLTCILKTTKWMFKGGGGGNSIFSGEGKGGKRVSLKLCEYLDSIARHDKKRKGTQRT